MSGAPIPSVVVVGSLHYDIMVDAPDRPRKGETVTGHAWAPKFGGKGGNQAVAAAKAGATVRMAGAVGNDAFGHFLLDGLEAGGVDASRVSVVPGVGSGMSVAISDSGGDYGAVIVSGANLHWDCAGLADPGLWRDVAVLVLQNEMPEAVNLAAAEQARAAGVKVCLNAAPFRPLGPPLVALVDILVVNAIEAEQLSGLPAGSRDDALLAAQALLETFETVVVTVGSDGVVGCKRGEPAASLPAQRVALVSTHGAGDVFVGALVKSMASGHPFLLCLEIANDAAATHVSAPRA